MTSQVVYITDFKSYTQLEWLAVNFVLAFVVIGVLGWLYNRSLAIKITQSITPVIAANFSDQGSLQAESANDYLLHATGRKHIDGLSVHLKLKPRNDLLSGWLFSLIGSAVNVKDTVKLEVHGVESLSKRLVTAVLSRPGVLQGQIDDTMNKSYTNGGFIDSAYLLPYCKTRGITPTLSIKSDSTQTADIIQSFVNDLTKDSVPFIQSVSVLSNKTSDGAVNYEVTVTTQLPSTVAAQSSTDMMNRLIGSLLLLCDRMAVMQTTEKSLKEWAEVDEAFKKAGKNSTREETPEEKQKMISRQEQKEKKKIAKSGKMLVSSSNLKTSTGLL